MSSTDNENPASPAPVSGILSSSSPEVGRFLRYLSRYDASSYILKSDGVKMMAIMDSDTSHTSAPVEITLMTASLPAPSEIPPQFSTLFHSLDDYVSFMTGFNRPVLRLNTTLPSLKQDIPVFFQNVSVFLAPEDLATVSTDHDSASLVVKWRSPYSPVVESNDPVNGASLENKSSRRHRTYETLTFTSQNSDSAWTSFMNKTASNFLNFWTRASPDSILESILDLQRQHTTPPLCEKETVVEKHSSLPFLKEHNFTSTFLSSIDPLKLHEHKKLMRFIQLLGGHRVLRSTSSRERAGLTRREYRKLISESRFAELTASCSEVLPRFHAFGVQELLTLEEKGISFNEELVLELLDSEEMITSLHTELILGRSDSYSDAEDNDGGESMHGSTQRSETQGRRQFDSRARAFHPDSEPYHAPMMPMYHMPIEAAPGQWMQYRPPMVVLAPPVYYSSSHIPGAHIPAPAPPMLPPMHSNGTAPGGSRFVHSSMGHNNHHINSVRRS